jgi:radical SAM superfamily enzyme YgiQ (UPF0313 family)
MKITLISPYPDITSFGIRTISAYLKQAGHQTTLIFLPDPYGDDIVYGLQRYDEHVLDGIIPLCDDSDMIGISLMTNFYEGAVQITQKLKSKLNKPILWGGVHPTIRPEECLNHADIVCIGDGEDPLLELLDRIQRKDQYWDTRNFWFKRNGSIIKNPVRPLNANLDVYPMPDYSLNGHYLMFEDKIQKMTPGLVKLSFERSPVSGYITNCGYQTMTGRGCPHKCTYCVNDTLKNLYCGKNYLRWRSTNHVINELQRIKERMSFIGHIWFSDDSFFARNSKRIDEFCTQYKKKIGLPFFALASPMTVTEEKMNLLVDAGLKCLQMGIETGSERIQELFNRKQMTNKRTMKALQIINKYKKRILTPHYDFILDTPFETDDDKIQTLRFISRMPKPYHLQTFSLVLYPGTQLYDMANAESIIKNEKEEIYNRSYVRRKADYLNLLFSLVKHGRFPGWLLRILVSIPVIFVLNSEVMRPFFKYCDIILKYLYRRIMGLLNKGKGEVKASK